MNKFQLLGLALCACVTTPAMADETPALTADLHTTATSVSMQSNTITIELTYDTEMNIDEAKYEDNPVLASGVTVMEGTEVLSDLKISARAANNSVYIEFFIPNEESKSEYTCVVAEGLAGDNTCYETDFASGKVNVEESVKFTPFDIKYKDLKFDFNPLSYNLFKTMQQPDKTNNPTLFEECIEVQLIFDYEKFGWVYPSQIMNVWGAAKCGVKVLDASGNEVKEAKVTFGADKLDEAYNFYIFGLNNSSTQEYTLYLPNNILGTRAWSASGMVEGNAMGEYSAKFVPANAESNIETPTELTYDLTYETKIEATQWFAPVPGETESQPVSAIRVDLIFDISPIKTKDSLQANTQLVDSEGNPVIGEIQVFTHGSSELMFMTWGYQLDADEEYTLVVGKGEIGNNAYETSGFTAGVANDEIRVPFKPVTYYPNGDPLGVENVAVDANRTSDVYNLQGVRVRTAATAADINNLPAGLYIIDGRKVKR